MASSQDDRLREEKNRQFWAQFPQVVRPQQPLSEAGRPHASTPARPAGASDVIHEGLMQVDTGMRSAANTLTFGGADHLDAGMRALVQPGGLGQFKQNYEANLAQDLERNRYDAVHRPIAQNIGAAAGTLFGFGKLAGAAKIARLPGAATASAREVAALLGAAGAGSAGIQAASGYLPGAKRSSVGDIAGAGLGGVAGAVALPLGPARAGAVDGWVTSVAQDALNRRPISPQKAGQTAMGGGLLGGIVGHAGTQAVNSLSSKAKGQFGEALGEARSTLNGLPRQSGPKVRDPLNKGYWVPDGRSGEIRFEDKFGYKARLSKPQTRAQAELGPNFVLYHTVPDDIGGLASLPAAAIGSRAASADQNRRR